MHLIDSQAIPRAESLYQLLQQYYGNRILLAQQETPSKRDHTGELRFLQENTGKLPAILGLDFIHNDFDGVVERAIDWDSRGGIVSICWHTGVAGIGYPESQQENPDFEKLLTSGTPEHKLLKERWRAAAAALKRLQDRQIPVLWRPFHEFDGQWFWWGKGGPESFIRLWRMMVDTFRSDFGLHNLIWILGYADDVKDGWDPGADYCDIAGSDTYKGTTTNATSFRKLNRLYHGKPLAFHEIGQLPEPQAFFDDDAVWSWIMPWHTSWLTENNSVDRIKQIYEDPRFITLDKLTRF